MIGTQAFAEIASTLTRYSTLDGWTFLGDGCYRTAFLAPDGVVYKVQHHSEHDGLTENAIEHSNFKKYGRLIESKSNGAVRLARSHYFESVNVIAMEYVPKSREAMWYGPDDNAFFPEPVDDVTKAFVKILVDHNLFDVNASNLWYDHRDVLVMVDYAG